MTISSETRTAGPFNGNGSTTAFPFTFKVFATTDVVVVLTDEDGIETTKTIITHYTVSLNADQDTSPGGTVTMLTAPATGELLTLTSNVGNLQPVEITNQGGFYPSVINTALDRAIILIQQLLNKINRSVKIPLSDGTSITTELPTATLRANKALVFDADGNVDVSADDYEDQATNAAASAAAAAASAVTAGAQATIATTQASTATTQAGIATTQAAAAAASATAAQTAVSSVMWQDVVFLTSADSPYTIGSSDSGKLFAVDCTSGAVTVNLPSVAALNLTLPWAVGVKKTDSTANAVTIARNGTDTIDGATSKTISTPDAGATFIPDVDPSPDRWTTAVFGATAGNISATNYSGDGSTVAFTLASDPGTENNTFVWVSGVYQQKNTYSVSGTTLTFSSAPASGTNNIEVLIVSTLPIGTPSDGTVTTAKIADGNVTTAKIADGNVTSAKLSTGVVHGMTAVSPATGDYLLIADTSDSNNAKKSLVSDVLALSSAAGRLIGTQYFTSPGSSTYTPTSGTSYVIVEVWGAGGSGGANGGTGAGAGAAGGYCLKKITSSFSGVTVTVGAGGTSVSGAGGNNGGTSSFGAICSATGGNGGLPSAGGFIVSGSIKTGASVGGTATGGDINTSGGGGFATWDSANPSFSALGGAAARGASIGQTAASTTTSGTAGSIPGGGGLPGANASSGAGGAGLVIVWEYS